MAEPVTLRLNVRHFVEALTRSGVKHVDDEIRKAMVNIGRAFTRQVQMERLRGGTTPERLKRRTGALARSLGFKVEGRQVHQLTAYMGFGPPAAAFAGGAEDYAHIHETGGTIHAVNQEFLAIPIADNLTAAGVARIRSPLELGNARFIPWVFDDDTGYLVFEDDDLMFALKHHVEIPARLHFGDDWHSFVPQAMAMLDRSLRDAVKRWFA